MLLTMMKCNGVKVIQAGENHKIGGNFSSYPGRLEQHVSWGTIL